MSPLNSPNVVPWSLNPNKETLFVGGDDGRLYRLDVTDEPPYPTYEVDTRRPSCVFDRIVATPAVQLYDQSGSAFQTEVDSHLGHEGDDVVFVVTSTGCADTTHNRIIAYWASDLSVKWVFNAPMLAGDETGPIRMGGGTGGFLLDYANDRLYLGTDAPSGSSQDSLWAVSSLDGRFIWSDNAGGAVLNRPTLNPNNNRLYVVNQHGALWAYDPDGNGFGGPSRLWTMGLQVASPGAVVQRSPWVEPRPGTWQDKILSLDSAGVLFGVEDTGTSGFLLWTSTSLDSGRWVSTPVVLPGATESQAFIGRSDGYIQMVKLDGGQPQGILQITSSVTDVFDPVLDTDPGSAAANRLVVVGGTTMARIAVPICTDPPAAGTIFCNCSGGSVCGTGATSDPFRCCNLAQDSCNSLPSNNPCRPMRCNTRPSCCAVPSTCVFPGCAGTCATLRCATATQRCQLYNGTAFTVDDGVVCDDHQSCTAAVPAPVLVDCVGTDGETDGPNCLSSSQCPGSAPVCSGSGGGGSSGGAVTNGWCCPHGTACKLPDLKCVGNFGSGVVNNDVCRNGACASDDYGTCACVNPGDRACSSNETCCGSSQGGCVNLDGDPQHCGACTNDCGEYTISTTTCTDNPDCGSCVSDGDCASFGGKCVDGACGKCRGDTSATGQPACGIACTTDAQCGGGSCTNGFCCASGRECVGGVGGSCLPLVCHRLTNRGVCTAGVCTSGAPCIGPDLNDMAFAGSGQKGMCSVDFEFTSESDGTSLCGAYVTDYRTDGLSPLAAIDDTGGATDYTSSPPDTTRLNGVAVSRDGGEVFAAMVNDGSGTPGMALRGPGLSTYSRVKTALATGGIDDLPFDQVEFNRGPVGPAFDYVTFTSDSSRKVWFGNFKCPAAPTDGICTCVDNALCRVDFSNGTNWTATLEAYCGQSCPGGLCDYSNGSPCPGRAERITAIAFEQLKVVPATVPHRHLIVAHGTTLSFVDLDGGIPRQRDVNLADVFNPNASWGLSTVEEILSIAPMPYGDVIVEVRGAGDMPAPGNVKNTWLLNVNAHDRSVRHELDVQHSLKHVGPCMAFPNFCPAGYSCFDNGCLKNCGGGCPDGFTCSAGWCHIAQKVPRNFGVGAGANAGNGRIAVMPSGKLLRWVAAVDQNAASMAEYDLIPSAPVKCNTALDCDDGNPCTADSCAPGWGFCLHAPIVLTEPGPAQFSSSAVFQWPPTADASHWNTYRGTIPANMLGSRPPGAVYDHVCFESGDALGDGPNASTDISIPPLGTGFYYLVSGEAGCESVVGHASSGASIPNASPCPTPP